MSSTPSVDLELCERILAGKADMYSYQVVELFQALIAERQAQADVLRELVRLKRIKARMDDGTAPRHMQTAIAWMEYQRLEPLAWQSAFDIVDALPPRSPTGEGNG